MKVLITNTRHFLGGGDSTYTFNLSKLLKSKGHDVAFFAMDCAHNFSDPNSDLFVSYIDFRNLNRHKNLLTGFKVFTRAIYSFEARRKFGQIIDRFQPNIVHLQNIHAHITPSVIFEAKKRGMPVVWTLHDYKLICPNSHFLIDDTGEICEACGNGAYYQAVLKRCKKGSFFASFMASAEAYCHYIMGVRNRVDRFLAPSVFLKNKLLERKFPADKVAHIPYLLPDDAFCDSCNEERYLLFLGKLDPIKGICHLLRACQQVENVKLVIAGRVDEPIASKLRELLPCNAEYVGIKYGEELRHLLTCARAVVMPSVWYENQPFSIIEAFAAGKPVIASDLGGMTELVKDGERGILVPPGNTAALANAMQWMAMHPQEANQMGRKAREYAKEMYSAENHYKKLMQVYKDVWRSH